MKKEKTIMSVETLPRKLVGLEGAYIRIPRDIIRHKKQKIVLAYTYFATRYGLDYEVAFTLNHLVSWCGYVPNSKPNRMNESFIDVILTLNNMGYISFDTTQLKVSGNNLIIATFNYDYLKERIDNIISSDENDGSFAIIYIDEIKSILSYKIKSSKFSNMATLLTTFAYIRSMIYFNYETSVYDNPEVHYDYCYNISNIIHINPNTLTKLIKILDEDLSLIYYKHMRKKDKRNNTWITLPTIFSNTYRRYKGKLYDYGEHYYTSEINKQICRTNKYFDKNYNK